MNSRRDKSRDVRDVCEQHRADFTSDLAHAFEINDARIRARADGDHFRPVFTRH